MSRVEELPDDFDESLRLNKQSNAGNVAQTDARDTTAATNGPLPALPPEAENVRSSTADEVLKMMSKSPLFMTSLEDAGEEGEENLQLEAIKALQYEGTPSENALNFKEQGNEMVRAKKWQDARDFYSQGIAVLSKKIGSTDDAKTSPDQEAEQRKEREIEETLYTNRALANLELRNYRSTTLDCAAALRLNIKNTKAYYRSALALFALDKIAEATDACQRGLAIDSTNQSLKTLSSKISTRASFLASLQAKRDQETHLANRKALTLQTALKARNIRVRRTAKPPELEDATIHLAPDPLSATSTVNFPVLLLYPLHAQSDFIKAMPETDTIAQHLEYIFPLPWDREGDYTLTGVELYVETAKGGLSKVARKMALLEVLTKADVEVVDELVKVNVVPKAKAGAWIEEMKARKVK